MGYGRMLFHDGLKMDVLTTVFNIQTDTKSK